MKILILGGSGFVGKNMQEYFCNKYEVDAPSHKELDALDEEAVFQYIKKKDYDVILNALDGGVANSRYFENRLRMYMNLSKHRDMYGKMIFYGSGAEYARELPVVSVSEKDFNRKIPEDSYGFCLHQMSLDAMRSDNIYNLRLFGIFGKYELWRQRFISNAICKGLHELPITIRQNRVMDYLCIDDLCKITEWMMLNKPSYHDYNATSGRGYELLHLAELVNERLDKKMPILVAQEGFAPEYTSDNTRLMDEMTGFKVESMEDSIDKLVEWYEANLKNIDKNALLD